MASLPCPKCGSSDAVEAYDNGDFCFSCHYKVNTKRLRFYLNECTENNFKVISKQMESGCLTDQMILWFADKGITISTLNKFGVKREIITNSIVYPIKITGVLQGYQLRKNENNSKKIMSLRYSAKDAPFLFVAEKNRRRIAVIVEDPVSAMRIWQDAKINTLSLLGTNLTNANRAFIVSNYDRIIVWMDGDLAGYEASKKIVKDCQSYIDTQIIFTEKDPKDLSAEEIQDAIGVIYE